MRDMTKLTDYRKIFDTLVANVDSDNVSVDFDIYDGKIYVNLQTDDGSMFDDSRISEIVSMFKLVDIAMDLRVYELGESPVQFRTYTVELLQYATDDGFVLSSEVIEWFDSDIIIDFIRDNTDFTVRVNEKGEVIVS